MLPALPPDNLSGVPMLDAKAFSQSSDTNSASGIQGSHFSNFLLSEFYAPAFLAFNLSALLHHVVYVLSLRPQKQMLGIYADRIVAIMKHGKTAMNLTDMPPVRKPVYPFFFIPSDVECSMPILSSPASRPIPATSKLRSIRVRLSVLVHLFPKSLLNRFESLVVNLRVRHKTKTHPAPQKYYRRSESRSRGTGWRLFLSPLLLTGCNRAEERLMQCPTTCN